MDAEEKIEQLIQELRNPDSDVRSDAAGALGAMGREGVAAIAPLYDACRDEDRYVRGEAVHSLWEIAGTCMGTVPAAQQLLVAGVPTLVALLDDASSDVRCSAMAVLSRLGPAARPALPRLRALLADEDPEVKETAAETIESIAGSEPDA